MEDAESLLFSLPLTDTFQGVYHNAINSKESEADKEINMSCRQV